MKTVTMNRLPTKRVSDDERDDQGGGTYHPLIEGLLKELPSPEAPKGEWAMEERANWLQTAASIFSMLYTGKGAIKISFEEESLGKPPTSDGVPSSAS